MKIITQIPAIIFLISINLHGISQSWTLTGNAGINPSANFIGTTDNRSLRLKTNNIQRMIIDSVGNIGIAVTPLYKLHVGGTMNIDAGAGTGTIMRLRVNNGFDTYYGDASSDLHWSGRLHTDQLFFPDGGISFNSWGAGIALNNGPISGISNLNFNSAGNAYIKMSCDYNAFQPAADQGIIVKYTNNASGIYPRAAIQVYKDVEPTEVPFMISAQGFGWLKNSKPDEVAWTIKSAPFQVANLQEWQNSTGVTLAVLNSSGRMGIGTNNVSDTNYRLFVEKGIRTRKVKVDAATWADNTLGDGYNLMSLESLKKFIQRRKHLPEVLAEQEVKTDGIDLGEMQVILLKKIEELTLYLIEEHESIVSIQNELRALKQFSIRTK